MELNELLMKRRSIRSYKEAEVREEDIRTIIEATLLAASWKNTESGRYYVAISEEAKKEVYDALPDFNQNSTKNAAYIIAAFKKGLSGCKGAGEYADELKDSWGAYDLGLQNSYLMLKASELGYDTLIMGLRDVDKLRKYFGIPEDEIIMPVIAIGVKDKEAQLRPRKGLDEVLVIK
ncbi:MAG: nitroreductase family protein [Erysipelotrichaceae bacterium]|nr:nitroreductase family protein [Erysipelotrichaceae bacterium]